MTINTGKTQVRGYTLCHSGPPPCEPLIVHQGAALGDLDHLIDTDQHVFVSDDDGRLVGVVEMEEIRCRLFPHNVRESERWRGMPVKALLPFRFPAGAHGSRIYSDRREPCAAWFENDRIVGLITCDDVLISWSRVSSMLKAATTDPLTGLLNRASYERRLHEEWSRARRLRSSVGVILVDVDRFKSVNDEFGHLVGDAILQLVATTLERSVRSYDLVARYGGDEFIALCVGCQPEEIEIPIRRVWHNLQSMELPAVASGRLVTVSVGAAVRHVGFSQASADELVEAADACLYKAKSRRGSAWRIEFFDTGGGRPRSVEVEAGSAADHQWASSSGFDSPRPGNTESTANL